MIVKKTLDIVTRDYFLDLMSGSVPDMDVTRPWHRKGYRAIIRPDQVHLRTVNGVMDVIKVTGYLIKKDGTVSIGREDMQYHPSRYDIGRTTDQAPEWLREIMAAVQEGHQAFSALVQAHRG